MWGEQATKPFGDQESLEKIVDIFEGVRKASVGALVLVLIYTVSAVFGIVDSLLGISTWLHLLAILLVHQLAHAGARLARHVGDKP